jgi:hypothetical protein
MDIKFQKTERKEKKLKYMSFHSEINSIKDSNTSRQLHKYNEQK